MDEKNQEVEAEETLDLPVEVEGEEDTTDWKAEAKKLQDKAISQRERTKTLKQQLADARKAVEVVASTSKAPADKPKAGELDETTLDYLDLKGISEAEDISLIQRHVERTGETVRQALKDDYVQTKLKANQESREVKAATPSSTKRSGAGTQNDLALAIAKFEQSGGTALPEDFALRSAVVNAMEAKTDVRSPRWNK